MKSVFDGWTKKIEGQSHSGIDGHCALGYLSITNQIGITIFPSKLPVIKRIGSWIQQNLNPPTECTIFGAFGPRPGYPMTNLLEAIMWANDECKLDIEGFKMVDLLTQGYVPEPTVEQLEQLEVAHI